VVVDSATHRVYVAHGDKLAVLDAKSGELIGQVEGATGGTHGTAISFATGQGFTDDGRGGVAIAFDLKTLKVSHSIPAAEDADAMVSEPTTGHVFVIEGDPGAITVIDPKTGGAIANIKVGEKLEYAASGEPGVVYVAGNESKDVVKIDAKTNTVTAHWPTPDCTSPHGLAYDPKGHRLFMGCVNSKLMVVETGAGKVVAELDIGRGNDAVAFDTKRHRVFSSNGIDGTITVYQQVSPDKYEALPAVTTAVSGRTMDVDPDSGNLFVAAADLDPPAAPGTRPRAKPGTLRVMIFTPAK
jgi:DNA-binding beta-propeller fold protein YncE